MWNSGHVFFATSHTVQNDIKNHSCPAAKIVLLVIDEAHNARGDHSFCKIVQSVASVTRFFRVLALTATPGRTFEDIQNVIYNLLIEKIEYRTRDDCAEYVHNRDLQTIVIPDSSGVAELAARLNGSLQVYLRELLKASLIPHMDPTRMSKGMLVKALTPGISQSAKIATSRAIKLCNLRERLVCFSIPVFVHALDAFLREEDQTHDDETAKLAKLLATAQLLPQNDPRLDKLTEIVSDFLKGSPTSKIIVYCSYRMIVGQIVTHLNSASHEIRAVAFTGQASSAESKGQNQGQQMRIMELFRQGRYNVIVSTSIGEEGLDICEVDFIICYDAQKSPIRTIQRIGRTGRHRDGQVLFMLSESTKNILHEAEMAQDMLSLLITRRRSEFQFFQSPMMNPERWEIVFKEIRPEMVHQQKKAQKEIKRATLLMAERDEMESIHGKELRYGPLSMVKFMEFQTSTTSLTDISFSAESAILGEMVSLIAENDRFTVRYNEDSLFAVDATTSSTSNRGFSLPSTPLPVLSVASSASMSEDDAAAPLLAEVDRILGIELSSSSWSDDSLDDFLVESKEVAAPMSRRRQITESSSDDIVCLDEKPVVGGAVDVWNELGMTETDSFVSDSSEDEICPASSSDSDDLEVGDESKKTETSLEGTAPQPAPVTKDDTTSSVFDFSYSESG
jgi:Fanconi anemia group M protein